MWIFGYGSLLWKTDFPFREKITGYIKGYVRRFYQASEDHRGVPGKPGRVVTLLPSSDPEAKVWGVAYEITEENQHEVLQKLDFREKNGYEKVTVTFYPCQGGVPCSDQRIPFDLVIYVGTRKNKWFLGEAKVEEMARQIVESSGPSGTNTEYLYRLASAMRMLAPQEEDHHLFELETAVRRLEIARNS